MDTLVIGLDGLDRILFEKFESEMPNLKQMEYCDVLSTNPAMTHVAWPTAMSGRNKADKIVLDGVTFRLPPDAWYGSFWDHCPQTCAVINVPYTWDEGSRMVEGSSFVAGMSPSPRRQFHGVPSEVVGNWPVQALGGQEGMFDNKATMVDVVTSAEARMVDLVKEHIDAEFMVIGIMSTDYVGHMFWGDDDKMLQCYTAADKLVGSLLDHYKPDRLIVFSDHGMMPIGECSDRDYPPRIQGSGMCRGHTGGHRMHGTYFDFEGANSVENMWDIYYKITQEWGEMSDTEKALVEKNLKAMGYM